MESDCPGLGELVTRLDAAVRLGEPERTTQEIKRTLEALIGSGALRLPERFRRTRSDHYARRLLHRDEALRYSAVVMAWGPGQRTSLHDHAGTWCVEGVVEGQIDVTQYELVAESEGAYAFAERGSVRASVGSAGCLIPPFEYHVLANAREAGPSVTLHVYGGEMTTCHIFEPRPDGRYARHERMLAYSE